MKSFDEMCKTPGKKIRSKGKGKGLGTGDGEGPLGVPSESVFDAMAGVSALSERSWAHLPRPKSPKPSGTAIKDGDAITVSAPQGMSRGKRITGKLKWDAEHGYWTVYERGDYVVIRPGSAGE